MQSTTDNLMGKVTTTLVITNRIDQANAEDDIIPTNRVRSVTLKNVLVDTEATTLCLPANVIKQLGLKLLKEVNVATATGLNKARIFQDAKISLCGREGTYECLELPGGRDALLGVFLLEMLGIELDLKNQSLYLLPIGPDQSYLTIL